MKARDATSAALGARIRQRREAAGDSITSLAKKSGINPTYLGQVERGERNASVETVVLIAEGLSVDAGDLVRGLRAPRELTQAQPPTGSAS
jgi:transcriptional regulator with XRE-family HTH domain